MDSGSIVDEYWVDYKSMIREIGRNLPTLPVIVSELTNILEKTDNSTQSVEDVMVTDQAITTRILKIANTSFYRGNREKVTDANDAIGMLGFDKIKDLILTTSVFKVFASKDSAEDRFSLEGFWKHCIGVAAASRNLANSLGKPWPETAYTCGLIHDIGKVARFKLDEDNSEKLFLRDSQTALDRKISFFHAELANNSPRHDYLGYLICRHWGLSSVVEGVVRWHHEPDPEKRQKVNPESKLSEIIDLVILANWIVNSLQFGFSGHETPQAPPDSLFERLQIYHLERVVEEVKAELVLAEDFCSMLDSA